MTSGERSRNAVGARWNDDAAFARANRVLKGFPCISQPLANGASCAARSSSAQRRARHFVGLSVAR